MEYFPVVENVWFSVKKIIRSNVEVKSVDSFSSLRYQYSRSGESSLQTQIRCAHEVKWNDEGEFSELSKISENGGVKRGSET